jgi:hypothetical protein
LAGGRACADISGVTFDASAQTIKLGRGRHQTPRSGVCVVELASLLADEPFDDRPRCVDPVIAGLLHTINDALDNTQRQRLIPYAPTIVGTAGGWRARYRRARLCARFVADREPGRRSLVFPIRLSRWGKRAADVALRTAGTDAALDLCDRVIAAGPHVAEPQIPAVPAAAAVR